MINEDEYENCESLAPKIKEKITLLEKLKFQRENLQKKLNELDDAIKALENNPEFEKMINILGKVTHI